MRQTLNPAKIVNAARRAAKAREGMTMTRAQFALAAMAAGLITPQEAEDWAAGAALPALVAAEIAKLPEGAPQIAARIEARAAANVNRLHPLVVAMGASLGLTDAQIDQLFT